jgi:hypothetical protein
MSKTEVISASLRTELLQRSRTSADRNSLGY